MTKADEGDADEDGDEVGRLSGGAGPAGGETAKRIVDNEWRKTTRWRLRLMAAT